MMTNLNLSLTIERTINKLSEYIENLPETNVKKEKIYHTFGRHNIMISSKEPSSKEPSLNNNIKLDTDVFNKLLKLRNQVLQD